MLKKYLLSFFILISTCLNAQISAVGIGTTNPQQKLHLASPTGTIRVDGLNSPNNEYNGGGIDTTYPLYVNKDGDFTLTLSTLANSDGNDYYIPVNPGDYELVMLAGSLPAGTRSVALESQTITVPRDVVLEVKYNISFQVLQSNDAIVKDTRPRNITTYYTVDGGTRRYGQASKSYYNNNDLLASPANGATQTLYNASTTYIPLTAGTHTINFYGYLATGVNSMSTKVKFGVGNDSIFMRLY